MNKVSTELEQRIERLAHLIFEAKRLVVFTGAGISTESGLPDFRGPDGIWTRKEKGLSTKPGDFSKVKPNTGHMAIAGLQKLGKLTFLVSQNFEENIDEVLPQAVDQLRKIAS